MLRDDLPLLVVVVVVVSAAPPEEEDSRETKCLCWVKPLTLLNRRPPKLLLVNIVLLLLLFLSLPFAFPFVLSVAAGDPQHLSIYQVGPRRRRHTSGKGHSVSPCAAAAMKPWGVNTSQEGFFLPARPYRGI
jgi:hypothetical protein